MLVEINAQCSAVLPPDLDFGGVMMGLIDNFLLGAAGRLKPLSVQACRSGGSIILAPRSLEYRLFGLPRTQRIG